MSGHLTINTTDEPGIKLKSVETNFPMALNELIAFERISKMILPWCTAVLGPVGKPENAKQNPESGHFVLISSAAILAVSNSITVYSHHDKIVLKGEALHELIGQPAICGLGWMDE